MNQFPQPINNPTIIDLEASGFDPHSYPIEVGLALSSGERYSSLILPEDDWTHWDEKAEKLHQISQKTLLEHGKPVREVADQLNQLLKGQTVYSDGWVVDKPWLDQLFYAARVSMQFYLSPLEMILSEQQMAKWEKTRLQVLDEFSPVRHRASIDAWIIKKIYQATAKIVMQMD